uniref:amidohydrolase n=1 Tax=Halomonas sp. TaxID=1486246 RepID=UPI00260277E9|nr:amidohydrolase [Halomonas sp.]
MTSSRLWAAIIGASLAPSFAFAQSSPVSIDNTLAAKVIEWRRDIHQHPELGNQETRTAGLVADHLKSLGMEVRTGIAVTGVVGFLEGGKPGPTIALRADMDALPVTEQVDLPFKSEATARLDGKEVGVMHACGHDGHVAMLMGAAEQLAAMRDELHGNILFIFQPAEEGMSNVDSWGAKQMLDEGIFDDYAPEAIFGIHLGTNLHTGTVAYRSGPILASSDSFEIRVKGRQTHGGLPWNGIDPIVTASQIVTNSQSIVSRQVDLSSAPAVISYGIIDGGLRQNIIPDEVRMEGTIRNFDMDIRSQVLESLTRVAESTAQAQGAEAEVHIHEGYPVTVNDPQLTEKMLTVLREVVGDDKVIETALRMPSEDFSYYAQEVPGMFVMLGATPADTPLSEAAPNHSPHFNIDEEALETGTNLLVNWAMRYSESET